MTIQLRGDTAANWTSVNPVLAARQVGLETDTRKFKVGDGTSTWTALTYWGGSGGSSAWGGITGTLSAQTDLQAALDGKQPLATVLTNTTAAFTTAQETKLGGIATGATANDTDANLRNRANHTGTQAIATVQAAATARLFGRNTAGAGPGEELTAAQVKTMLAITNADVSGLGTLATQSGTFSGTSSGTNTGDQTTITGNAGTATALQTSRNFSISGGGITAAAVSFNGSAAVTLSASVDAGHITLARMANLAANSIIGNNTGTAATPLALTGTQATALLDTFTTSLKGLAPASGGGTTNFLRADGTWAAPPSGGSPTWGSITGTLSSQTDLQSALNAKAPTASPTFTGTINFPGGTQVQADGTVSASAINATTMYLRDTDLSHFMNFVVGANLTANRALTFDTGDASRTITIPGDASITGTNTGDETYSSITTKLAGGSGGGTTNFLRADGTFAAPGGGGAPGGATGEIQYNNAGAFAGAANVEIDTGNLKLVSTTDPAAPTGGIALYSKLVAGRHLPKMIGPSGIDTILQVGLSGNSVFMVGPASGTTAPTVWGGTLTTAATMSNQQTIASANPWQATFRKRFATAATAGSGSGMRTAYVQWFRGNAAGFGGFFFRTQFGQNLNVNGAQVFHGLCASTAVLATTAGAVGALVNMIGMGYDTTDSSAGNWQLFRNDGTGTATKVDLGANAARNTTHGYDLIIYCPPGAATEIFVRVINLHSNVVVLDTSYTTDLPAVNTGLAYKGEGNNGAVASAMNLEVAKVYIESDY